MTRRLPLSILAALIQETIESVFFEETFWVIAEITDVKKYETKRWCFLKFIEKNKEHVVTEFQGVFWANAYQEIINFERKTGQPFASGIEISCRVAVRYHPRYGLKLEVQEIDATFTLGQLEMERQQTLDKLLRTYPGQIQLVDGEYVTLNKQLQWPKVLQRVALIAAANSDGERDFQQELLHNQYGYAFQLTTFHASVQGQYAAQEIVNQLDLIHHSASSYDVLAIVRGGGSNTDFAAFDQFEVAKRIALFPIPVFTGIGHDRNTSISDMLAWQFKTPTKVAAAIVDTALRFENDLMVVKENLEDHWQSIITSYDQTMQRWNDRMQLIIPHRLQRRKERLHDWQALLQRSVKDQVIYYSSVIADKEKRLQQAATRTLQHRSVQLQQAKRLIEQLSPEKILNRGFAMVMQDDKIITDAALLNPNHSLKTILKNKAVISDIKSIEDHE